MKTNIRFAAAPLMVALLAACGIVKDLGELDTEGTSGGDDASSGTGGSAGEAEGEGEGDADSGGTGPGVEPLSSDAVDILFVVDNSGSMGASQAQLAAQADALTGPLMAAGVDFRIAVTTTDNGNPWCSGTTPEGGEMELSSCRSRLGDFIFNGALMLDVQQEACLDVCDLEAFSTSPTPTQKDPALVSRPWVEWSSPTSSNIDVDPGAVLSCAFPTGINGCGFEQPLESMYGALQRSGLPASANYGFVRPDASLLVVFVSDEVDCSNNPDAEMIFLPEGGRAFWSLPDEGAPTSAVCWNAGVLCQGTPPNVTCEPADRAPDGSAAVTDAEASLFPVSRYSDLLVAQQAAKSQGRVRVMALMGRAIDGTFVYGPGDDASYLDDFGIGPGCGVDLGRALPPVRVRALANAINETPDSGIFSICDDDYGSTFAAMAAEIISWSP